LDTLVEIEGYILFPQQRFEHAERAMGYHGRTWHLGLPLTLKEGYFCPFFVAGDDFSFLPFSLLGHTAAVYKVIDFELGQQFVERRDVEYLNRIIDTKILVVEILAHLKYIGRVKA